MARVVLNVPNADSTDALAALEAQWSKQAFRLDEPEIGVGDR